MKVENAGFGHDYPFTRDSGVSAHSPDAGEKGSGHASPTPFHNNCALLCGNFAALKAEHERANYNAEAAAANLTTLQEYQRALAAALADLVMLKAQLADAKDEVKDLKRGGMSWEDATCGEPEV